MPYIVLKRDDIPNATLQVLDLAPNESQRNVPYEPFGQTKYVNALVNELVFVSGTDPIVVDLKTSGLAAWFLANVADGGGASLTKAEAEANAAAVIALLNFGDLGSAAGVLDLTAVNAAVTGTLVAADLRRMLEVLSGRTFTIPAGVQVDASTTLDVSPAIGATGGPFYGEYRHTYDTGSLVVSFNAGKISGFLRNDFEYQGVGGTNGEALAVYNDDGTLFS